MKPTVIADHVWDSGSVRIALIGRIEWHRADCDPHYQMAHEVSVKTTPDGYVLVVLPEGNRMELIRQSGPVRSQCDGWAHKRRFG